MSFVQVHPDADATKVLNFIKIRKLNFGVFALDYDEEAKIEIITCLHAHGTYAKKKHKGTSEDGKEDEEPELYHKNLEQLYKTDEDGKKEFTKKLKSTYKHGENFDEAVYQLFVKKMKELLADQGKGGYGVINIEYAKNGVDWVDDKLVTIMYNDAKKSSIKTRMVLTSSLSGFKKTVVGTKYIEATGMVDFAECDKVLKEAK